MRSKRIYICRVKGCYWCTRGCEGGNNRNGGAGLTLIKKKFTLLKGKNEGKEKLGPQKTW